MKKLLLLTLCTFSLNAETMKEMLDKEGLDYKKTINNAKLLCENTGKKISNGFAGC